MRTVAAVGLAGLLCASTLAAQYERRYEVGAFGAFTKYDKAFGLADKIGGGVRFGYALGPSVSLEAEILFQPPHTIGPSSQIEPIIGGGSLVLSPLNRDRLAFYVLAGYSVLDFGGTNPYRFSDGGVHAGVGTRIFFSDHVALRFEGRGIYTPETKGAFGQKSATHIVGSVGFAMFQADAAPAADADHDRVGDKRDACPDTPTGATVDKRGCPGDADTDGVFNGIDGCPDTPQGATVDATGCPHDQDNDKVLDGIDQCPNTAVGLTVDAKGCPPDSDGDGVDDGLDKCPDTPAGATVDPTGCPNDSDHDLVWDALDKCPDTPTGAHVDANGCPLGRDTDGDGVIDPQDRCPNTPAGSRVDQFGCLLLFEERAPAAPGAPAAPTRPTLILSGVTFQTGRSVLTTQSYAVLDQVAGSLVANPEISIEIAGYTDNTGSLALNRRLSGNRAIAVRFYLARKGVSPSRMIARGYGPASPVATNTTPEGRAQNRRVELHKLP